MKWSSALSMVVACAFLQGSMAAVPETSGLPPTPAPTAKNACRDGITTTVPYGAVNFDTLDRKAIKARLREIAGRTAADPRVRQQLACLMKR